MLIYTKCNRGENVAVLFLHFQWSSVLVLYAMSACGIGLLFCLFGGSVLSIKRHEWSLGTTSPSSSFLSFLCLAEVRLFILPQTFAVLGVDVKVPGACGAKGYACMRSAPVYLFVHINAKVNIGEHVCVGVVHFLQRSFISRWS